MATKQSRFSERIAALVTSGAIASDIPPNETTPWAMAIKNQFLVAASITDSQFTSMLAGLSTPVHGPKNQGGVFGTLVSPSDEVVLWEVTIPSAYPSNVFSVVDELRASMTGASVAELAQISPNHVLVPASLADFCPWGPATPHRSPGGITMLPDAVSPIVPVTVIDVGYQWNGAWGKNPLGNRVNEPVVEVTNPDVADWSTAGAHLSPETTQAGGEGQLVALAGHANFVAGVIAQVCGNTQITIVNLNGAYEDTAVEMLPTESWLAHAMLEYAGSSKIINVSFACTAHTDPVTKAPIPAPVWAGAFSTLKGRDVVVVAPVGNQGSEAVHFPAALGIGGPSLEEGPPYKDVGATNVYEQMIGVASSTSAKDVEGKLEAYTNRGHWVSSSCDGSNIVSTFLDVHQELEDDLPGSAARDFTATGGWASWSGTCFAAAKISGLIAAQIAESEEPLTALEAWQRVYGKGELDTHKLRGMIVPH